MGLVYADLEIIRSADVILHKEGFISQDKIRSMQVKALVDSGAYMMAINENIKTQLDLHVIETQIAELADGSKIKLDIVGPIEIKFKNRSTTCRAMVLPGDAEVLLGSIPMEDLDVWINPKAQTLEVNPNSPFFAKKSLK